MPVASPLHPPDTLPTALVGAATRQAAAFYAGSAAFLDCLGDLFIDEGRLPVQGTETVRRSFTPILTANARADRVPPRTFCAAGWCDVGSLRSPALDAWVTSRPHLRGALPHLAESDVVVWLAAAGRPHAPLFFNAFRLQEGHWRVVAFGSV
jgi:hypothetical protein